MYRRVRNSPALLTALVVLALGVLLLTPRSSFGRELAPVKGLHARVVGLPDGGSRLDLSNRDVGDEYLVDVLQWLKLTDLRAVDLSNTKITDASVEQLLKRPDLRSLDLSNTSITDAGLEQLRQLSELEFLMVSETGVTAAAIRQLQEALPRLSVRRESSPWVGIEMKRKPADSILVMRVHDTSPAEKGGILKGDRILEIDGQAYGDDQALIANISRHAPGDQVRFKVDRAGETLDLSVTLTTRPDAKPRAAANPK